ncbi:mCG140513, partial [Mus musculus]
TRRSEGSAWLRSRPCAPLRASASAPRRPLPRSLPRSRLRFRRSPPLLPPPLLRCLCFLCSRCRGGCSVVPPVPAAAVVPAASFSPRCFFDDPMIIASAWSRAATLAQTTRNGNASGSRDRPVPVAGN